MTNKELKPIIEAILFAMGEAVTLKELSVALELPELMVKSAAEELMQDKESEDSGVKIIPIDGGYQMCTKEKAYEYLIKLVQIPKNQKLTDVQLETLSIIAYKQPVTKLEIEKIRGVSADHAINRLMEAGLIEEAGRMNTPGRPILFVTSREFLRRFGLGSCEELPDINTEKVETFKMEAEEEIGYHPEPEESVILTDEADTE